MKRLLTFFLSVFCCTVLSAQEPVTVKIDASQPGETMSPYIYGQFIEHLGLISEHFYIFEDDKNIANHVRKIPNTIRHIADAHRKYRTELPKFKDRETPVGIALDEWNYWYGEHVFGELGTRYFMKDALGIAAGLHEFARQSDMYFMANYAQTVNVIGCIKTSKTAAKMETTGLALELYRKHFGGNPVKTVCENPDLDVQATRFGYEKLLIDENNELTIGVVNSSGKPRTLTLDIAGFDVKGKKITRFEIADPENDPNGFNDPYRIEIVETPIESSDGMVTVKPYSITLLKYEE